MTTDEYNKIWQDGYQLGLQMCSCVCLYSMHVLENKETFENLKK